MDPGPPNREAVSVSRYCFQYFLYAVNSLGTYRLFRKYIDGKIRNHFKLWILEHLSSQGFWRPWTRTRSCCWSSRSRTCWKANTLSAWPLLLTFSKAWRRRFQVLCHLMAWLSASSVSRASWGKVQQEMSWIYPSRLVSSIRRSFKASGRPVAPHKIREKD